MIRISRYLIYVALLLISQKNSAQNITGTWEGRMGLENLMVNIVQNKNELCGFTYDYNINRPEDHCKAYFKGVYNKEQEMWILVGTSFIENSGSHILMQIKLWKNPNSNNVLNGSVDSKDAAVSLINWGSGEAVRLTKVPTNPDDKKAYLSRCFPKKTRNKIIPDNTTASSSKKIMPPAQKVISDKNNAPKTVIAKPAKPLQKQDTVKKQLQVPVNPAIPDVNLIKKLNARKNNAFSHLQVNVKNITLSVYDNGIVDNDTVSIFYNGRLLAGKKPLSEKALTINLELDETAPLHEITMYAENLGSIPPNTALIVVKAGSKRYELHSKASLEENAVLVFEYKPD